MDKKKIIGAAAVLGVAIGVGAAPAAGADTGAQALGSQGTLVNGDVLQGWTISDLKVSTDVIPHATQGTLWEATATDEAIRGTAIPIVSNLNARSASGEEYRVLFGVATAQGVNPSPLPQGEKTTGKVYFDVTGAPPTSVVYRAAGGEDLLVWDPPAPAPAVGAGPSTRYAGPSSTPTAHDPGTPTAPDPATAAAAPAAGQPGPQVPPSPVGRQGTPLTDSPRSGTQPGAVTAGDLPAEAPAGGAAGTPVSPAPASVPPQATPPAPTGSAGTPVQEGQPHGQGVVAPTPTSVVPTPMG